jgi:RTX calcium-binding nonapeptide repeat (4 copies)
MSKLAKTILAAVLGVAALMAMYASPAGAAVSVGQTAPSSADVKPCFGATMFLNSAVAAGSPSYAVPPGGGVLTQWSARGGTSDGTLKLKVVRETAPMNYLILATDLQRPIAANMLNTFPIHIPVSGGELLALWLDAGSHPACYDGATGDIRTFRAGSWPEPNVGDTFVTNSPFDGKRTNVAALLEPDCDKDGLGDETEDTNLSSCTPSTTPTGPITGPGGAPVTCKGLNATIVGTAGNDVRTGSLGRDVIAGLGGNDTLSGIAGSDVICGGPGKDLLKGGKGKDTLLGQKGKDALKGGGGKDLCKGGKGKDTASGCEVEKSI